MPPRLRLVQLATSLLSLSSRTNAAPLIAPFLLPAQQRCASILSSLSDNAGAYNKKIRRGRGPASGKGKTGGRGQKGQHAHGKVPAGFEGGQTPQWITNPERGRGKHNPFKVEMSPINLDRIQEWIDQGRVGSYETDYHEGIGEIKVFARREETWRQHPEKLTTPIHIVVSRASADAIARVEALGGSVTTRFYSPTAIKRVLRGETHPVISLQASPDLVALAGRIPAAKIPSPILTALQTAAEDKKNEVMAQVMKQIGSKYKYRLSDATARKDIEYYRDPAHRGYLNYLMKEGESPSLFFKPPGEAKDRKKQSARKNAAKASAENRLF
ncbi:50S ribosomal subunit protein L15 [Pyrenophora tritici-repentis Pt-1C-BFP]|uniref:50S ribosomal subunit protein L15 n=1 Tax=Pyrenophora tritici-repentis (strain Pt-1C-BFP) TaxID=426418 RepID=B2WIH5_PYRTR|nr:mitochondrial 54S ribosomal protein YmL10/YmL18 [Pyrenophora tritici-repentis Pt-1C-BFP]EDU42835.1 50S ribosomal subunit protein L15 [Pyrenophora tritici-repentis Pt-1C-BFP]